MARLRLERAPGLVGILFENGSLAGLSDEQLLGRFVARRAGAENAFGALVRRHGPMVLSVCQSALGDRHEAEDAFQATFLVLARRASSLREPARLSAWLHGVARRTAQKMHSTRVKRPPSEPLSAANEPPAADVTGGREGAEALHEEISCLAERDRLALLLCYFEGLTHEQAAQRLGWPVGTLSVRLMRARARLRDRLTRRGIGPAACLPAAWPRFEPVADVLVTQTSAAAFGFAASTTASNGAVSSTVTTLSTGVLRIMTLRTLLIRTAALLACGAIAAGSASLAFQDKTQPPPAVKPAPSEKPKPNGAPSLLVNGGFEQGDPQSETLEGWKEGAAVPGVATRWDRTVAHGGKGSLHFRKTVMRYFPIAQWTQEVKRTGTAPRLKVSAFIKTRKMTKAILDIQFLNKQGEWTHAWAVYIGAKDAADPPATHDWKQYEGVVAIPEGTEKLLIAPQVYGPGDVWFDDITAEYTDAPATDPTAP